MLFENSKHLKLWSALLNFIEVLLYPTAPICIIIAKYDLAAKTPVNKFGLMFIVFMIVLAFNIIKYILSQVKFAEAYSDGQYKIRFILEGVVASLKWVAVIVLCIVSITGVNAIDVSALQFVRNLVASVMYFAGSKLVAVWYRTILIKPLDFQLDIAHKAYLKNKVEAAQAVFK